jgi:hypothetical protein
MAEYGEVQLGDRVKATVDGFTGICIGITEYLHQCRQVLIKPERVSEKGDYIASVWMDEPWVTVTQKGVHKATGVTYDKAGRIASGAIDSHPTPNVPSDRR